MFKLSKRIKNIGGLEMIGRKTLIIASVVLCILGGLIVSAFAQENTEEPTPTITANLDVVYMSKYIWRGLTLNPDPAIQPSLTISHKSGLSYNFWGSIDTTNAGEDIGYGDKSGEFTEIDHTLSYCWSKKSISMSAGLIHYTFPNTYFDSTNELFISAGFSGILSPVIGINYDVDEADGAYLTLAGSHSIKVGSPNIDSLNLSARIGFGTASYNKFYFGVDKSALTDLLLGASLPIKVGEKVSITPSAYYSIVLDNELRDAVSKPDQFFGGVSVSYSF